jgi:hypothetical protein
MNLPPTLLLSLKLLPPTLLLLHHSLIHTLLHTHIDRYPYGAPSYGSYSAPPPYDVPYGAPLYGPYSAPQYYVSYGAHPPFSFPFGAPPLYDGPPFCHPAAMTVPLSSDSDAALN